MLRLSLGDYAATPNVSLFLGKSISAYKSSPQMVDLNCTRNWLQIYLIILNKIKHDNTNFFQFYNI